jgi:ketosteroid isomerase-like protein
VSEQPSAALSTALAYYQAWTGKDLDRAMRYVAEDVVCENPTGRIEGLEAFRQFMTPFAQMLTGSDLLGAYGDADTAVLVYNPHTTLVADAPSAERFTVRDGRIVHDLLIFDRTPFDEARRRAG